MISAARVVNTPFKITLIFESLNVGGFSLFMGQGVGIGRRVDEFLDARL